MSTHTHMHTHSNSTPLVQTISPTAVLMHSCACACVCDVYLEKRDRVSGVTVRRVFMSLRPSGKCGVGLCVDASKYVTCQILPNATSLLKWPGLFRLRKSVLLIRYDCLFEEPSITEQNIRRTFIILRDHFCHIHLTLNVLLCIGFSENKECYFGCMDFTWPSMTV